ASQFRCAASTSIMEQATLLPRPIQIRRRALADFGSEPLLQEIERQVDAGAHARRRDDRTLVDDLLLDDANLGKLSPEGIEDLAMGRRPMAVEQASPTKDKRAGANRGDNPRPRRALPQKRDDLLLLGRRVVGAGTTGDDQRIQGWAVVERGVDQHAQATARG